MESENAELNAKIKNNWNTLTKPSITRYFVLNRCSFDGVRLLFNGYNTNEQESGMKTTFLRACLQDNCVLYFGIL